jgi:prepilin-type N-terminal cleavage/methylation domain-containing protein
MIPSQKHLRPQAGFTLVELAIVMIIIGLLIAGVLKGQALIANAQVTATVAQVKAIEAATSTFKGSLMDFGRQIASPLAPGGRRGDEYSPRPFSLARVAGYRPTRRRPPHQRYSTMEQTAHYAELRSIRVHHSLSHTQWPND